MLPASSSFAVNSRIWLCPSGHYSVHREKFIILGADSTSFSMIYEAGATLLYHGTSSPSEWQFEACPLKYLEGRLIDSRFCEHRPVGCRFPGLLKGDWGGESP